MVRAGVLPVKRFPLSLLAMALLSPLPKGKTEPSPPLVEPRAISEHETRQQRRARERREWKAAR